MNVGVTTITERVPTALQPPRGVTAEKRLSSAGDGFWIECRFIRRPHLHQTRRTGAGESLAPRLLATRYYYRTRTGDAPEKTASRNCAASS